MYVCMCVCTYVYMCSGLLQKEWMQQRAIDR